MDKSKEMTPFEQFISSMNEINNGLKSTLDSLKENQKKNRKKSKN